MTRLCIYPKDVSIITGKTERHGRNILNKIRRANNKLPHQSVTVDELCAYCGLQYEQVRTILR